MAQMGDLSGKAVVLTGSGQGIGAACAKAVAKRGASIVVNDIDAARAEAVVKEITAAGGKAIANTSDISKYDGAAALIESCVKAYGQIDGLVNNAGVIFPDLIEDAKERDMRLTMEVNVLGTAFCVAHAVRNMKPRKSGSIVNVCSGAQTGSPTLSAYSASKGAVASFTYSWALELKDSGIRVNGLLPMAETRMRSINDAYRSSHNMGLHPSPVVPPESNAPVVEYFLSDRSRDITGQLLNIEGGKLALYVHPARHFPVLEREAWSMKLIDEAFREDFSRRLQPLGPAVLRATPVQ